MVTTPETVPWCDESICTDKPLLIRHFVDKHEFTGFECKKCQTGRDSENMTCQSFLRHVANCFNGRTFDCVECHKAFPSRHRIAEHECIPNGTPVESFDTIVRMLHGRMDRWFIPGSTLSVNLMWVMFNFGERLPDLPEMPNVTTATRFLEEPEDTERRERAHGQKYKLDDDCKIFREDVNKLPWVYRFMGTPWELGNGFMPDMKLALLNRFWYLPPREIWLYLVYRLNKYTTTEAELDEVKRLLQVATLPEWIEIKYREMKHICAYSVEIEKCARRDLDSVQYTCDNARSTVRPVTRQLRALEKARRKQTSLPVEHLPVHQTTPWSFTRQSLDVSQNDPCMSINVEDCLSDVVRYAPIFPTQILPEPELFPWDDNVVSDDGEIVNVDWAPLYLVFRDFLLYFVTSKTLATLKMFSNFFNEEPTWRDLTALLRAFKPYIEHDKDSVKREANYRAAALEASLQREILGLKNFHYRCSNVHHARCAELIELDKRVSDVKRPRLHRYPKY